jgi:hypothetical protein
VLSSRSTQLLLLDQLLLLLLLLLKPVGQACPCPHTQSLHSRVVVHHLAVGLVEAGSQVRLSGSQTDSIADALAKGACGTQHDSTHAARWVPGSLKGAN